MFLPLAYSQNEVCDSNLVTDIGFVEVSCSDDVVNGGCENLWDSNLSLSGSKGEWITTEDAAHDIPPFAPSQHITLNRSLDFSLVEIYTRGAANVAQPQNFSVSILIDGLWEEIIDEVNFNNTVLPCSRLDLGNNVATCGSFNITRFEVEQIIVNITDTTGETGNDNLIFPELMFCGLPVCDFPTLFCDNFNYVDPLSTRDWTVFRGGSSVDDGFSPDNNTLNLSIDEFRSVFHDVDPFETEYLIDFNTVVTQSINSPVFSTELDVKISDGGFRYGVRDNKGDYIYILRAVLESNGSASWSYANTLTTPLTYTTICSNCSANVTFHTIKTNIYFDNDGCTYDFNSSIDIDHWDFIIDNVEIDTNISFLDSTACNANEFEIIKDVPNKFVVDDYFVMSGTDRNVDTTGNFFTQLFDNITVSEQVSTGVAEDMATNLESIWVTFGLRSALSRAIAGMLLMLVFAVIYIMTLAEMGKLSTGAILGLGVIEFMMMILLTIVRLLPIWIPFVLSIIGGAGAFITIRSMLSGGGG